MCAIVEVVWYVPNFVYYFCAFEFGLFSDCLQVQSKAIIIRDIIIRSLIHYWKVNYCDDLAAFSSREVLMFAFRQKSRS